MTATTDDPDWDKGTAEADDGTELTVYWPSGLDRDEIDGQWVATDTLVDLEENR